MDKQTITALPQLHSRLPGRGTTIFEVMSLRANQSGAVNLSQGFPNFPPDPLFAELVGDAIRQGFNQYAPLAGLPALRQQIAGQYQRLYDASYTWENEITVLCGATEAVFTTVLAFVQPGDEVIVLEPSFDSYLPGVTLSGGTAKTVQMTYPDFRIDWAAIRAAITPHTRLLMLNSPHNPSGSTYSDADIAELHALVAETDILIFSDEVYEHMIYDGALHHSLARYPALAARSVIAGSFGKSLHMTGWRIGYVAAPAPLTAELRKVHQFVTFAAVTPIQKAIADYLALKPDYASEVTALYQQKRDYFGQLMAKTRFKPLPTQGSYFQLFDYSAISDLPDVEFCTWLCDTHGVAGIPLSAFYKNPPAQKLIRFCFAKQDATLEAAAQQLISV